MTIRDERIANFLAGIQRPEDQGKEVKSPSAGEIIAWLRDVDPDEMRRYMQNPRYGSMFKISVEAAQREYNRRKEGGL